MERYIIIAADVHNYEEGVPVVVRGRDIEDHQVGSDGTQRNGGLDPLIFDNIVDAQYFLAEKIYEYQNPKIIRVADLTNSNNFYERDEDNS